MFNQLKGTFVDAEESEGGPCDEALLKEFDGFKRKLNGQFKYAKIFKDEAVLQREQDEKRKQQEEKLQEQSQGEENNGGMRSGLADLTLSESGAGSVAVQN